MVTKIDAAALDNKVVKYEDSSGALQSGKTSTSRVKSLAGFTTGNEPLSVYDEGTWTPVLKLGSTTVSTGTVGRFTRIGNRVFYYADIEFNRGTNTGTFTIEGLPVAPNAVCDLEPGIVLAGDGVDSTPGVRVCAQGGSTTLAIKRGPSSISGTLDNFTHAMVAESTATVIRISGSYFV